MLQSVFGRENEGRSKWRSNKEKFLVLMSCLKAGSFKRYCIVCSPHSPSKGIAQHSLMFLVWSLVRSFLLFMKKRTKKEKFS